ncbi:ABC transporter substrate-binding protein [Alsobacter sp. R-9]
MPYRADDRVVQARVAAFRARLLAEAAEAPAFVERWTGAELAAIEAGLREMIAERVEVVLTTGSRVVPLVQRADPSLPLVFVGTSDPVGQGFVDSLARPGRNTTGFSQFEFDQDRSPIMAKLVELLSRIAPGGRTTGLMFDPANPAAAFHRASFSTAVVAVGSTPILLPVRSTDEIRSAMRSLAAEPAARLILPSDLTLLGHRRQIIDEALALRLPTGYSDESFVAEGGLLSYSPDRKDMFAKAAGYVARILEGEDAGLLPVQQPTAYLLSVNARTAQAMRMEIPSSILVQADELVE